MVESMVNTKENRSRVKLMKITPRCYAPFKCFVDHLEPVIWSHSFYFRLEFPKPNDFQFNNETHLQTSGTNMGKSCPLLL